jgi:LuxR family maltose regulon positive regulatory protein
VAQTRVQVWLAQNNLAQANTWAVQTTLSPQAWDPLRKWEVLLLARVALAEQQYARAVETLERFSWHLDQPADIEKTLEWMALYAVALHHSGKRAHAARVATRLLTMTEPEGYVRVYLDAGEPMRQVLEALLEAAGNGGPDAPQEDGNSRSAVSISRSSVALVLAAFEQEERKRAHRAGTPLARTQEIPSQPPPAEEQPGCAEPLSPQEQRVLRLLVAGEPTLRWRKL